MEISRRVMYVLLEILGTFLALPFTSSRSFCYGALKLLTSLERHTLNGVVLVHFPRLVFVCVVRFILLVRFDLGYG